MSTQPVAGGFNAYTLGSTSLGTVTIKAADTTLVRMIFPANATGTVAVYDSVSGTNSLSYGTYACTVGSIPSQIELGISLNNGLTVVTSGTTNTVLVYD